MKLSLHNIGKMREASIDIDGITVIAGENDTGKSTMGKALFAVFNSFYNVERQISDSRRASVRQALNLVLRSANKSLSARFRTEKAANYISEECPSGGYDGNLLEERLIETLGEKSFAKGLVDPAILTRAANRINEALMLSDEDILTSLTERRLYSEFNGQIANIFNDDAGEIVLTIQNQPLSVWVNRDSVLELEGRLDLHTEAIYIDDPFVLDDISEFYIYIDSTTSHKDFLRHKLRLERRQTNVVDEILTSRRFQNIYNMISSVCGGEIVTDKQENAAYRLPGTDRTLEINSLSTGLKTFVILKRLLMNGTIGENGTIILDEPEIHLHPEWQLLLAELIVLLHREFGIHVLLTTHSPYFLNAIEVYAAKHDVDSQCRYYLTRNQEGNSSIDDVTGNLEAIYSQLARPLQELENQRYRDD